MYFFATVSHDIEDQRFEFRINEMLFSNRQRVAVNQSIRYHGNRIFLAEIRSKVFVPLQFIRNAIEISFGFHEINVIEDVPLTTSANFIELPLDFRFDV